MVSVYKGYVWKHGTLEWVAANIVARSNEEAANRAVSALRRRPGLKNDPTLTALSRHLLGYGECPEGVTLQVVKEVDKPTCECVAFG